MNSRPYAGQGIVLAPSFINLNSAGELLFQELIEMLFPFPIMSSISMLIFVSLRPGRPDWDCRQPTKGKRRIVAR